MCNSIGRLVWLAGWMMLNSCVLAQNSTNSPTVKLDASADLGAKTNHVKARLLLDHARADMANGRLAEAEQKLRAALVLHPENRAINYYLTLIRERRDSRERDMVRPIYPVIKRQNGSLEYGAPVQPRSLREAADDLKGK